MADAAAVKRSVLGVQVDQVDYDSAVSRIVGAATQREAFAGTALAVHGVMTGVLDAEQRTRLNGLDLVTPDGQPVRWALNLLHRADLKERVYGPELMLRVCAAAERHELAIYLYGSKRTVLDALQNNLRRRFRSLQVAGAEPSGFRELDAAEWDALANRLRQSGAAIVFVGLGCPRQETFVYEMRSRVDCPLLAVGAAFDYHAGLLREPPEWVQRRGLQWLYRLAQNPLRLWRRYLVLNPLYLVLLAAQKSGLWKPSNDSVTPTERRLA